ncbi:MAG: rhodanese-like domain-containing protein [Acidimicrobiia bacterium]|nr:rhodanese-like domain-containing protein [Acidimicrobiia bacterium]
MGEVDVRTAAALAAGGAPLIDVREPDEYEEVRASGAVPIPLGDVPARIEEIPRDRTVYVICRSGGRSLRAAEFLAASGVDAVNVAGGTLAWVDADLPVERGR